VAKETHDALPDEPPAWYASIN